MLSAMLPPTSLEPTPIPTSVRERIAAGTAEGSLPPSATSTQQRALSVFAVGAALAIGWVAHPVGMGILLGTLLAFTVRPLYTRLLGRTKRPTLSAMTCVAVTSVGLFATLSGLSYLLVARGLSLAQALLASLGEGGLARVFLERNAARFGSSMNLPYITGKLRDAAAELASRAAIVAALFANMAFTVFLTSLFTVLTLYFILRNWTTIASRSEDMLPLEARHTHALFEEFERVGRATLLGTVVTGAAQGLLAAAGYWMVGLPEPAFFGAATAAASLLPGIGTMLVWVPAGVYLMMVGEAGRGILELCYGALVVVGLSDYVIRPRLVSGQGEMPALLTFAALFGGVEMFGLGGLIVGPLVVSIAYALLRIYARETAGRRSARKLV